MRRVPATPGVDAARQRPVYLAGNTHRMDIGVERYGAMNMVLRNSVVQERALIIGSDSGGWENSCNESVVAMKKWFKYARPLFKCDGMITESASDLIPAPRVITGVADHQLHVILANAAIFSRIGGHLPRLLHQLLTPNAGVRPVETLFYTEAGLLGEVALSDVKLL